MRSDTIYAGYLDRRYVMMLPKSESTTRFYVDDENSTSTHNCIPWDRSERAHVLQMCVNKYSHLRTEEFSNADLRALITPPKRNIKITLIRKEIPR